MSREKQVDPKKIPAIIKVVVCVAHTKLNTDLVNEIAATCERLCSTAEIFSMVKVCLESQAVYKDVVRSKKPTKTKGGEV